MGVASVTMRVRACSVRTARIGIIGCLCLLMLRCLQRETPAGAPPEAGMEVDMVREKIVRPEYRNRRVSNQRNIFHPRFAVADAQGVADVFSGTQVRRTHSPVLKVVKFNSTPMRLSRVPVQSALDHLAKGSPSRRCGRLLYCGAWEGLRMAKYGRKLLHRRVRAIPSSLLTAPQPAIYSRPES